MKTNIRISMLLFVMVASVNQSFAQMKTLVDVNRSFSGISKIEVSGGSLDIEYLGNSGNEVSVNAFLESTNHDQDIVFVTMGNVLKISHKVNNTRSNWGNVRTKGHIKIRGPQGVELDMKGGSGNLNVENVTGDITNLAVGSGNIKGSNINGDVYAKAGSGAIKLSGINGDVKGQIGSGSAEIMDVAGSLSYNSGSGGVKASDIRGLVNISLTSGNAKLDNVAELGDLKLTSGNLDARNAGLGPNTRLNGTSGNFKIQTSSNIRDFNYSMSATSGNITVGNSRGSRNLSIDNGASDSIKGSITSGNISIVN
jgi:lia operon protein LiaG